MKYVGDIISSNGNRYRVFWDAESKRVEFSDNIQKRYIAPPAKNEDSAKINAKEEAEKIESSN